MIDHNVIQCFYNRQCLYIRKYISGQWMARQTTVQGDGLTDLRSRTVRDKYPHTPKENLAVTMPKVF